MSANSIRILCITALSLGVTNADDTASATWSFMGQGLANLRSQSGDGKLSVDKASQLKKKWTFKTGGDVSATPSVADDAVYFPDWAGNLYAVRKQDGRLIWTHKISDYNNWPGAISRVTPAIAGDDLIIGDIQDPKLAHLGANIIAVNRHTGDIHWITQVDRHPAAIITGSPVVWGTTIYVGVSSIEEGLATDKSYTCCTFRGSMVALNLETGRIIWKTFTTPENNGNPNGYSGNAIWQPPAIDPQRGTLYVGTGNNYEVPDDVKDCIASSAEAAKPSCFDAKDYFDATLALDLSTGQVRWSRRLQGVDVWTVACVQNPNPMNCPIPSSPDYDLGGSGPNLLSNMVGFGQKSGIYWALNPDTGEIKWSSVVGPGGTLGGIEWGTAADDKRIYIAVTNSTKKAYPLIDGTTITSGAWSALDINTGKILWQTADPANAMAMGSVSVSNGIMFAPSMSGNMHALDASTGKILWTFASGGSVLDGPAIADSTIFWGSGYKKTGGGTGNNKVYAFEP